MKSRTICGVVLALMLVAVLPGYGQESAEQIFQSGLYKEEVEGDLKAAIQIYERILEDFPDNRSVAAKALLQMGLCYEKLGVAEAREAYRRLIQEFADQRKPAQIARERLQRLDADLPGDKATGPTYRLVLNDETPKLHPGRPAPFDFSPSGDQIVFQGQGGLRIADSSGTVIRPLPDNPGEWRGGSQPRWSPSGELIAYTAWRRVTSDPEAEDETAIFVVSPDGGSPQQIGLSFKGTPVRSLGWTPDSRHLTYLTSESDGPGYGIHTIALDGTVTRSIPMKVHWSMRRGGYSPDGRWLVFDRADENLVANQRDIWLLPAAGGEALRLTNSPAFDSHPTWAKDGNAIYFVSGRGGNLNIWKLALDPETGLRKGEPRQVTFFSDARVMFPRVLGDGGQIGFALSRTGSSIHLADASRPDDSRTLVRGRRPLLSPDGQTIYYMGQGPGMEGIFAISREGGKPRRLVQDPGKGASSSLKFDLSPDGQTLAYGVALNGGRGLFTLSTAGGEPQLLQEFDTKNDIWPRWSPDGTQLAYTYGSGLYVIPAEGGQPQELARLHDWEGWTVRWSPDGKYIAAFGYKPEWNMETNAVFVVPASGGEPRQLTPADDYKEGLEWHPDGQRLTYHVSLSKSETRQAYMDGRPPSLLLDHENPTFWDYIGVWAPDGRRFFFESYDVEKEEGKDRSGVYIYDEASGDVTLFSSDASLPRWSRDGKTMVWTTGKRVHQLWVVENFLPQSTAAR